MANRTRRACPERHPPELYALIMSAPSGVRWHRNSWVARRRGQASGQWESRSFSAGNLGYARSRQRAIDWQQGKPVPAPYDGIDLTRVKRRKITLHRRVLNDERFPVARFELYLERSNGCRGPWMRMYVGSTRTLDQDTLDRAVATLHARMARYRERVLSVGRDRANEGLEHLVVEGAPAQTQILLDDALAWTGRGEGITFLPASTLDPQRTGVFEPEVDAFLAEQAQAARECVAETQNDPRRPQREPVRSLIASPRLGAAW